MIFEPTFPTAIHEDAAQIVRDYFSPIPNVDTILVVNSCARGQAVPESDLDFAILVRPGTNAGEVRNMETSWQTYSQKHPAYLNYIQSNPFAHLHLDIIVGEYVPSTLEMGGPVDFFEIEIGNHIFYSAPMGDVGLFFRELQNKWLPYYDEQLRLQRVAMSRDACAYDLNHIPIYVTRGLYFQAFDTLYKAFQKYLQCLFITNKTYPIAYNKWIKEQITKWLNKPDLYPKLPPILSVRDIESNEVNEKARMLHELLEDL